MDTINVQINQRIAGMTTITNWFVFWNQKTSFNYQKKRFLKNVKIFQKIIVKLYLTNFRISTFSVKKDLTPLISIRQFSNLLLEKFGLESEFSKVYVVLMLFLPLSVTVASVERTFSKLKIIMDYKRNSIGQSKLRDLALLCIEQMDIKYLANAKATKKQF